VATNLGGKFKEISSTFDGPIPATFYHTGENLTAVASYKTVINIKFGLLNAVTQQMIVQ